MKYHTELIYTDIEWLKVIPSHWQLKRLKDDCLVETGIRNTEDKLNDGKYPFFVRSQTMEYIDTFSFNGEAILTAGDGVGVAKVFHHYIGKFETHQRVYRISRFKNIYGRFLFYYLQENLYKEVLKFNAKSTVDSLRMPMFQRLPVLSPPYKEQIAIAKYLDYKTQAIDKKIECLDKKIGYYKELRKSIINEAVTKGLDRNIKLKDSAINWMGKVPCSWICYRLDWITTIVRGNTSLKKDELLDDGEYVALQYGKTYQVDEVDNSFNFYANDELFKMSQVVKYGNTIFVSTSETIEDLGHSYFYNRQDIGLLGGEQILLKPNTKFINEKYLYYLSKAFSPKLRKFAKGLKVYRFNIDNLKAISIAIPLLEEQVKIVSYLDHNIKAIDKIVDNIETQITTLNELRKTLINDVVTGKIKVV